MKQRIWELDAFRGIFILGMVCVHVIYDLGSLYYWQHSSLFLIVKEWGGVLFLLLSGICVTLGRHPIRRGLLVFCCGLLCTAATGAMVLLNFAGPGLMIWFGILHCLGICMLLWPLFSRLPLWLTGGTGIAMIAAGLYFDASVRVTTHWLIPLGLRTSTFASSDYFPLLPYLGFFLLGTVLGQTLYRKKETLFPSVNPGILPLAFLSACGRHSLFIYLLHQPVLSVGIWLLQSLQH